MAATPADSRRAKDGFLWSIQFTSADCRTDAAYSTVQTMHHSPEAAHQIKTR